MADPTLTHEMIVREASNALGCSFSYLHRLSHRNDPPDTRSRARKRFDNWRWKAHDYLSNLWDALRGIRHDDEEE